MPELTHTTHTTTASNENGMWNSDSQTCGTKLPTPSRITNEKKSASSWHVAGGIGCPEAECTHDFCVCAQMHG